MEIVANATNIHKCIRQGGRERKQGRKLGGGLRSRGRGCEVSPDVLRSRGEGTNGAPPATAEHPATPKSAPACAPSLPAFASLSCIWILNNSHRRSILPTIQIIVLLCILLARTAPIQIPTYT